MSSNPFRKIAAALLISTLASLAAAPAVQAWSPARRSIEGPAREPRERGVFAFLRLLFDFTGGAMDPNGHK